MERGAEMFDRCRVVGIFEGGLPECCLSAHGGAIEFTLFGIYVVAV